MVSKACAGRSAEAAKDDSFIQAYVLAGQIFVTGFRGAVSCILSLNFIKIYIFTGLNLVAMATVIVWIARESFDKIAYLFSNLLLLLRALTHESLSKIQNFEFLSNVRCL